MSDSDSRLKRWRLILGGDDADGTGFALDPTGLAIDRCLAALYEAGARDKGQTRRGGLGASAPNVTRWLGDIRTYFPSSVVRVMQKDALDRLGLQQMLTEPEMLEAI